MVAKPMHRRGQNSEAGPFEGPASFLSVRELLLQKRFRMAYGRTVTLALALPSRLLFTVILPGLVLTRNLPLPVDGKVPMTAFVAVL